jgi:hypothetical protein
MFRDLSLPVFRLAALTALAGSALDASRSLLADGCRACALKAVLVIGGWAVPLSWMGLGGALLLLLLSFCRGQRAQQLRAGLALVGGGLALGLLLLQVARPGSPCPTCVMIDSAFLLMALVEATRKPVPDLAGQPGR